ncbi:MAG: hypothetical protein ACFCU6_00320 [Balneolaceae bacterium]
MEGFLLFWFISIQRVHKAALKEHHKAMSFKQEFRTFLKAYHSEYDERGIGWIIAS